MDKFLIFVFLGGLGVICWWFFLVLPVKMGDKIFKEHDDSMKKIWKQQEEKKQIHDEKLKALKSQMQEMREKMEQSSVNLEVPDGLKTFTVALPLSLYTKLLARVEAEENDLVTEAACLLNNAPRPSEATLEPLTEPERAEALELRMRVAALVVGAAQKEKAGA